MDSLSSPNLPIIDLSGQNLKPESSSWLTIRNNVVSALEEYGSFIATYDKIPLQLQDSLFEALKELFDLPLETKMKNVYDRPSYSYSGNSKLFSIYESMGVNKATTLEGIEDFTNTMWPNGNDHFSATMLSYTILVSELIQLVAKMMFERYGVEKYYKAYKELSTYFVRVNKYKVPEKDENDVGNYNHTDKSFITIVHQNQVNGLEVKTKDGKWIIVEPPPSSFVVIAGDAIMGWSNDRIHAPVHRVVMNNGSKARYSIGLFAMRKGMIEVPEELIDDDHPLRFNPFDNFGLLDYFFTEDARGKESTVKAYCGI